MTLLTHRSTLAPFGGDLHEMPHCFDTTWFLVNPIFVHDFVSGVVTPIGPPEYSAPQVLVRPPRYLVNYFFIIEVDGNHQVCF